MSLPISDKIEFPSYSTPRGIKNAKDMAVFTGTVLPVTFEHSRELKVYEGTKNDQGFGVGIHVVYDFPDNPPRFLHVDTIVPKNFGELHKLKVGDEYKDKTLIEDNITVTRLEDEIIGEKPALVFEWNKLWEIPGPVRDYFIPYQDTYVHIRATYSNTQATSMDNPMYTFDYVSGFDQILSSLTFIN